MRRSAARRTSSSAIRTRPRWLVGLHHLPTAGRTTFSRPSRRSLGIEDAINHTKRPVFAIDLGHPLREQLVGIQLGGGTRNKIAVEIGHGFPRHHIHCSFWWAPSGLNFLRCNRPPHRPYHSEGQVLFWRPAAISAPQTKMRPAGGCVIENDYAGGGGPEGRLKTAEL